jgi:hypothetical protein
MTIYGPPLYGPHLYGTGGTVTEPPDFVYEMEKKRDTTPFVLVEHIDLAGTVTNISSYYVSGGNVSREKERAPDEIQAGDFDIELLNHDNYFSEYIATSLFYGVQYHLSKIRISAGFILANGSTVTEKMCLGYIDEIEAQSDGSKVTLRCRDLIHRIIDEKLHLRPSEETPVAGGANVGDGTMSSLETKPFKVVNEDWTLTCTTPGADAVAVFSVVGSVSGDVGDATSGTEFSTGTGVGGIKFTITAGDTPWSLNDAFTFSTWQRPEWTQENPVKIIWSILTGYNYDTGVEEAWADSVLDLDSTRDDTNVDIDYASFVDAIDKITGTTLTGYVDYNESAQDVLESLLLLFLGSLISDADGKIMVKTWSPSIEGVVRVFADSLKITELGYTRSINEVINYVRVAYKKTATWQFSGEDMVYDGWYVAKDTDSITKYGKLSEEYTTRWYMSGGTHAEDFAERLLDRYAEPPLVISFATGSDGLLSEIGDKIYITDEKYGFSLAGAEISKIAKNFDSSPLKVEISARRDTSMDTIYGYLGSRSDEGDGLSPQADTYAGASASDKLFCYLGHGYKMY